MNPKARGGGSKKIGEKIKGSLAETGLDFSFEETTGPLDAISMAEKTKEDGYNTVCAVGGDGTAHETANGAIKAGVTFATIPAGSGNDFAGGLGMETWEEGLETLSSGTIQKISVLKAGERYVINLMDSGLGGDVAKASEKHLRWMSGSKKYSLLTLGILTRHKPYKTIISIDGKETEWDLNLFVAGFGQTFGSGMNILPDARFNHDEMHISLIHSTGRFKFLRLFPKVFSAKHIEETKHVEMMRGKEVIIKPLEGNRGPLRSEADGELFWEGELKLETIPEGLDVIIPSEWSLENVSLKVKN